MIAPNSSAKLPKLPTGRDVEFFPYFAGKHHIEPHFVIFGNE
jgi:hypothetical protein